MMQWDGGFNGNDILIAKNRDPSAIFLKEPQSTRMIVMVCKECGYVHCFADQPNDIDV